MSETFESFLKKHQSEAEWNKYYISTKKLGGWAWGVAETGICPTGEIGVNVEYILDIAIACLGKKEIEKRLNQIFNTAAKKQAGEGHD